MAIDAFFPKITLPSSKTDIRKGGGLGIRYTDNKGVVKIMVVDAFQGGEATNGLIAWLKDIKAEQVDLAVATHAHGDHTGGFYDIVNAGIPIKEFRCYHIDSIRGGNDASREDSDNLLELIRWLQIRGTRVLFVDHGDVIKFEDISWHIYRNQPARAAANDTNAWDYVNNGSLVLYSPELQGIIFGDGPENPKDAIAYFQKKFGKIEILIWFLISHHGNHFSLSNAVAAKDAGAKFAYESCVEADGPGTAEWTEFGARRVVQQKRSYNRRSLYGCRIRIFISMRRPARSLLSRAVRPSHFQFRITERSKKAGCIMPKAGGTDTRTAPGLRTASRICAGLRASVPSISTIAATW